MPFSDNSIDLGLKLAIAGGMGYIAKRIIDGKPPPRSLAKKRSRIDREAFMSTSDDLRGLDISKNYPRYNRPSSGNELRTIGKGIDADMHESLLPNINKIRQKMRKKVSNVSLANVNKEKEKEKVLNSPTKEMYIEGKRRKKQKLYNTDSKGYDSKTLGFKPSYPKKI